ncbi:MAG: ribosome maturation factor RimP, partial [Bacteroidetes bacterium]|nr:ribosome maturation factor RimP [Bacteroidota bacterium]
PAIDVFVDAEDGITSETCSKLSRDIESAIDLQATIRGPYTLTVSSPGIARPLKFPWQYRKHIGRLLEVKMRSESGVRGKSGKLLSVDEKGVALEQIKKGEQVHIDFAEIVEAKVKAPW